MAFPVVASFEVNTILNASADTENTINKPSGTVEGDLLVAYVGTDDTSAAHTQPGGWTEIDTKATASSSQHSAWFKVAGASEPTTYTWTFIAQEASYIAMLRITGIDTADPVDVSASTVATFDPTATPDVTTTVADTLVLRSVGANNNGNDVILDGGTPTSHTLVLSKPGSASGDVGIHVSRIDQASAGATGTALVDLSGSTTANRRTIAIAPAAGLAVTATTQSLLATPQTAAVNASKKATVTTQALIATPVQANISRALLVTATTASLILTPVSASLGFGLSVQVSTVALTTTAISAVIQAKVNVNVIATTQAMTATAFAASIITAKLITSSTVSLNFTANSAVIRHVDNILTFFLSDIF